MNRLKKLKRIFMVFVFTFMTCIFPYKQVRADMFGGDVVLLTQILANAVQQLIRLREIVGTARSNLDLIRDINRGLNDIQNLVNTIYPDANLKIYDDWSHYEDALREVNSIYGDVIQSKEALGQKHLDQSIVESMLMYNKLIKHSKRIDQIGENIQSQSLRASPKGASRLTAQGMGVSLHIQNQSLRTQSALLKLQAQNSALHNRKDKEETRFFIESSGKLKQSMKSYQPEFKTPRF